MWARWKTGSARFPKERWARLRVHGSGGVHILRDEAAFIGRGTDLPERRVSPPLVIEHFDVVEQLHLRGPVAVEAIAELVLDRREEALHDRVVVAITTSTHATHDPARFEGGL